MRRSGSFLRSGLCIWQLVLACLSNLVGISMGIQLRALRLHRPTAVGSKTMLLGCSHMGLNVAH